MIGDVLRSVRQRLERLDAQLAQDGAHDGRRDDLRAARDELMDVANELQRQDMQLLALRASEERFRALVENAFDVVSLLDGDGRLLYSTPNTQRVFGNDPNEFIGAVVVQEGVHAEDAELAQRQFRQALANPGQPVTAQQRMVRPDGSWVWTEGTVCNMLDNPHVRAMVVNSRDISERRRAEEAYRILVDHSLQGLVIYQDRRIAFANRAMAQMIGYTADELTALSAAELNTLLHPDDLPNLFNHIRAAAAGEDGPTQLEFRVYRKDGAMRWMAVAASLTEYRGKPAVQAATIDITDRVGAEEQARERQAELAHVLRVNSMGEIASSLAHEVNQPLSAIVNYARGCKLRLQGVAATTPVLEALEHIAEEALRAGNIIRGLRQFLRKDPTLPRWEDVNGLVADAVRLVETEALRHRIVIGVDLQPDIPRVRVDGIQIEQVIVNLIRNGFEAIERANGVTRALSIRTALTDSRSLAVSVCDSGDGVRADIVGRVFDPFFTTKHDGLGMGLSISRSIVHAHAGRIWATPNRGGGTTFSFTIPIASTLSPTPPQP